MSRTALLVAACAIGLLANACAAEAESIPPNCTLDPFTHKMNCPIPPNCTLDPFTHTMNCHPSAAQMSQSRALNQRSLEMHQ